MAFAMKKISAALKAGRARKRQPKVPSGASRPEAPTRNFGLELTPPHFPGGYGTFKKGEMLEATQQTNEEEDSDDGRKKIGEKNPSNFAENIDLAQIIKHVHNKRV